jgi:hypothetical protein
VTFGELEIAIGHQHPGAGARQQDCGSTAIADTVARSAASADHRYLAAETGIVLGAPHVVLPNYFRAD